MKSATPAEVVARVKAVLRRGGSRNPHRRTYGRYTLDRAAHELTADGRAIAEKMRHDMVEQTRQEQQQILERARREIETEKERAVAQLRREAVNLAIAGASKVIEENLDNARNRELVEGFLSSLPALSTSGR